MAVKDAMLFLSICFALLISQKYATYTTMCHIYTVTWLNLILTDNILLCPLSFPKCPFLPFIRLVSV